MTIYSVYVINRAGGLIYQMDHTQPKTEVEKTFSFPLELTLKIYDERVVVSFGQRDGIKGNVRPRNMTRPPLAVVTELYQSKGLAIESNQTLFRNLGDISPQNAPRYFL